MLRPPALSSTCLLAHPFAHFTSASASSSIYDTRRLWNSRIHHLHLLHAHKLIGNSPSSFVQLRNTKAYVRSAIWVLPILHPSRSAPTPQTTAIYAHPRRCTSVSTFVHSDGVTAPVASQWRPEAQAPPARREPSSNLLSATHPPHPH